MTPLLCVLVSSPGRGCRSRTHVDRPRPAIARAADAVELWIDRGVDDVMNVYNRWETQSKD